MSTPQVVIAKYKAELEKLNLTTIERIKTYDGEQIKRHRGKRRDIFRIESQDSEGKRLTFFLKRNLRPYVKNGLTSILVNGKVKSDSRQEWENSLYMKEKGFNTPEMVAYGEDCGMFREVFSFIITKAAEGDQTLYEFSRDCHDANRRRQVFDALGNEITRLHDAGLATPDLFSRHIFIDTTRHVPGFCFIDMARLCRVKKCSDRSCARDLAILNASIPLRFASLRERVQFLRKYRKNGWHKLAPQIKKRVLNLLKRNQFRDFLRM